MLILPRLKFGTAQLLAALATLSLLSVCAIPSTTFGQQEVPPAPTAETIRLGEQMYRDGLLPSGEPMKAMIRGDVEVNGTSFSCVSCHLRSGIGSVEGQILSPPTTGNKLYKPYYQYNPPPPDEQKSRKSMMDSPSAKPLYRSAYDDALLAAAIVDGVNPSGRPLNAVMPRYMLDVRDMAIMISYLKSLSAEVSPGVTPEEIHFATVIAGDVPEAERTELLAILQGIINLHNSKAKIKNRYLNYGTTTKAAPFNYPRFTLATWELKGPPATWRLQLETYYRQKPVFALLGGLSSSDWQPMHEFSEQNKIPCLLPMTDLPVVSATDWYTLYFNKGAYQEGEAAAHHLLLTERPSQSAPVVQIIEDSPVGRAASAGFTEIWKEKGNAPLVTVMLAAGEKISAARLQELSVREKPAAILLWTASGTLQALDAFAGSSAPTVPFYVASALLKGDIFSIPEKIRGVTNITWPYRIEEGAAPFHVNARAWLKKQQIPAGPGRISTRSYALTKVLLEPFQVVKRDFNPAGRGNGLVIMEEQSEMMMHVKRNYFRDYLLDVIGMMADTDSLDYERISFGPGQRYVSKGCYITRLSPGPQPRLLKQSGWVIH